MKIEPKTLIRIATELSNQPVILLTANAMMLSGTEMIAIFGA